MAIIGYESPLHRAERPRSISGAIEQDAAANYKIVLDLRSWLLMSIRPKSFGPISLSVNSNDPAVANNGAHQERLPRQPHKQLHRNPQRMQSRSAIGALLQPSSPSTRSESHRCDR